MQQPENRSRSILDIIRARRSVHRMKPERPPQEIIACMLEAATYAPNHHKAEPWHFFVLAGHARAELGEWMADALRQTLADPTSQRASALLTREQNKPLRAPVVIVVVCREPQQPNLRDIENVEAVAAAVQNMLLIAEEAGLATIWRTGDTVYDQRVKAFFGLQPHEHIIGMIYVGYLDGAKPEHVPTPYQQKTEWRGWDDDE